MFIIIFIFIFFTGCFSTNHVDRYDLTFRRAVTDLDIIPTGKVGEPYYINIDILGRMTQVFGKFYDINGILVREGMIEQTKKIKSSHIQGMTENLLWTSRFTNPQGLEFQLIQKSFCRECGDEEKDFSNQLIISGVPKKAGIYDFDFQLLYRHPYYVNVNYQLEILP